MFKHQHVVMFNDQKYGPWPARVLDIVECLRDNELFRMYELRLFGADSYNTPEESQLFAEERNITPFVPSSLPTQSDQFRRAISLAKRHLLRVRSKEFRSEWDMVSISSTTPAVDSERESVETLQPKILEIEWNIRKQVVNRLYRLMKLILKMPKKEAQDEALLVEQVVLNTSTTVSEYRRRVTELMSQIKNKDVTE